VPKQAESGESTERPEIPNRLYFRIGDVARIARVKPHVLRYWETEFPAIAPKKSSSGQRMYRREDVEQVLRIRHLLYERRFTIEGARHFLSETTDTEATGALRATVAAADEPTEPSLSAIRRELEAILALLT
jgi:DNA-binding transcriptional MerR regulator